MSLNPDNYLPQEPLTDSKRKTVYDSNTSIDQLDSLLSVEIDGSSQPEMIELKKRDLKAEMKWFEN